MKKLTIISYIFRTNTTKRATCRLLSLHIQVQSMSTFIVSHFSQ